MAALGEVPFGRYYGSVDSTPLFVMLAHEYYRRTADLPFIRAIWAEHRARADWMEQHGDVDGDGFLEYQRRTPNGLVQQGWKDSQDSVFHDDGTLAEAPIALCEVQGYAYAALARRRGRWHALWAQPSSAATLAARATTLRDAFEEAFWCDDLGTYALALDGNKRPCLRPLVEPRPLPLHRHRRSGTRTPCRRLADRAGPVLRVGNPDHRHARGALQPDVVPQRVGLAARQRDRGRRPGAATA